MTLEEIKSWNTKLKKPFKDLVFEEEGHKYYVKGQENRPIKSVSSLIKHFYEPFDADKVAPKYALDRGLEVEDVKLAWSGEGDIANKHGSNVHLIGEKYINWKYFKEGERPYPIDKQSLGCFQFINDLPSYMIPVAVELQMYSDKHWYSGTTDFVILNTKTNKFIVADWKSNNTIVEKGYFKKPPLFHIDKKHKLVADNHGKYSTQFSFYDILLEERGFEVEHRVLIHLSENKNKKKLYTTYRTPDIKPCLKKWLSTKKHLT